MPAKGPMTTALLLVTMAMTPFVFPVAAKEIPAQLPDPADKPPVTNKPVKVCILSGQSNMVGMGDIRGGSGFSRLSSGRPLEFRL